MKDSCPQCDDGEGQCVYPYYGAAPHICGWRDGKPFLGASIELPQSEWPANYRHDDENKPPSPGAYPGSGTYTHCPNCGRGK